MATTDRQATTLALAHALSAAERGLAVIPLSRTKLPALRSPHRDEPRARLPLPRRVRPLRTRRVRRLHRPRRASAPSSPPRPGPPATASPAACPRTTSSASTSTPSPVRTPRPPCANWPCATCSRSRTRSSSLTPSGGRHLWLTGPPDVVVPNSASRLAPGIDIRGAGGYLVGPGSRTDHGVYTHRPRNRPILPGRPARPRSCGCSHPRPARTTPHPHRPANTARASSSSCSRHTRASATPACSGPPAAPTRTASAPPDERP